MSHLFDFLCKSSEENEDFGSFMEFSDDMKNLDIPLTLEAPDLMSSEFFDSVLSMEQDSFTPTIDNDLMNICSDFDAQSPRSSDCGDSVTLGSDSGSSTKGSDDMLNINEIFTLPPTESNLDSGDMFNPQQTKLVVQQTPKRVIFSKPIQNSSNKGIKNKQQVIRVQSISGNGRSLLLPVNVKNVKKIKIINANDLKMENIKVTSTSNIFKKIEKVDTSDDEDDIQPPQQNTSRFPPLHLTNEEKRLLVKEGIKLPTHYPLSKNEEKELKRIRRKIRNKISAQDSRKRKKEYVDKLEEKAKRTTEENEFLKKRIKLLRKQNSKLMEQMRKLQTVLFKSTSTSTKATPTTCLMIVLFSTLLVCLPNLRLSEKQELGEQHLFAARRALLFNQKANEEDVNMDEFLVFNKDDESELESFVDEESENATPDNEFANFLSELAKKYENIPMDKNCSEMTAGNNGNGNLGEFCRKYEDEIKNVIHSMKEFLDTDAAKVGGLKEKGFIEPDISDDEDFGKEVKWSSIKEEPPSKRMKMDDDLLVNYLDTKQE